jgi:hypothetical protein
LPEHDPRELALSVLLVPHLLFYVLKSKSMPLRQ